MTFRMVGGQARQLPADVAVEEVAGPVAATWNTADAVQPDALASQAGHVIRLGAPRWSGEAAPTGAAHGSEGSRPSIGEHGPSAALHQSYLEAFRVAAVHGDTSVAFPLIGTVTGAWPMGSALDVAKEAVRQFLTEGDLDICLAVERSKADGIGQDLVGAVDRYLDSGLVLPDYGPVWSGEATGDAPAARVPPKAPRRRIRRLGFHSAASRETPPADLPDPGWEPYLRRRRRGRRGSSIARCASGGRRGSCRQGAGQTGPTVRRDAATPD